MSTPENQVFLSQILHADEIGCVAGLVTTAVSGLVFYSAMVPSTEVAEQCAAQLQPTQQTQFHELPQSCKQFDSLATQHFTVPNANGESTVTFTMPSRDVFNQEYPDVITTAKWRAARGALFSGILVGLIAGENQKVWVRRRRASGEPELA